MKLAAFTAGFLLAIPLIQRAVDVELDRHSPVRAADAQAAGQAGPEFGQGMIRYGGKGPEAWRWEKIKEQRKRQAAEREVNRLRRQMSALRRTLAHDPNVTEAINLAATVYGNGPLLWRRARCESHLDPNAKNRRSSAAGLFQFLDSTWESTPFARYSVYSPYANALAAGWMHGPAGRSGEWVCA